MLKNKIFTFLMALKLLAFPAATQAKTKTKTKALTTKSAPSRLTLKSTDGKTVSLGQYAGQKGMILVFTCNHCHFSRAYEDRIIDLHAKYAALGYPVVAVNSNIGSDHDGGEETTAAMQKRAKDKRYPFSYLVDENQQIANTYGATKTPEVFILDKQGDRLVVKYHGAIDDNAMDGDAAQHHYAQEALDALVSGKDVPVRETRSIGCRISHRH